MKQGNRMSNEATELEFLRFFYEKVQPCLGPADGDIIESIKKEFTKKTGKELPFGYEIEYELKEDLGYEVCTLEEFEANCKSGCINDYDGSAYLSDGRGEKGYQPVPCQGFTAKGAKLEYPSATHVHWYPK